MRLVGGFRSAIKRYEYPLLFATAALFLVTRLANLRGFPIFYDEAVYIDFSQRAVKYGQFGASLKAGIPPLHSWSMIPFLKVFSDPLLAARMLSVFFAAVTLTGVVLIGREFGGLRLGAWAGLLWVISTYALLYERLGTQEAMLLSLMVFAVFFAVRAALTVKPLYLLGTGICIGLAMWTKLTAELLFLVIPFAYLLKGPREKAMDSGRPLLRWLFSVALSLVIGYGIFSLLRLSSSFGRLAVITSRHTKSLSEVLSHPLSGLVTHLRHILGSLWSLMTPPILILCGLGLLYGAFKKWKPSYFCLVWFVMFLLVEGFIVRANSTYRYWAVLLPPLIFGGAYAVESLFSFFAAALRSARKRRRRTASIAGLIVLMAVCVVVLAFPAVSNGVGAVWRPERTVEKYDLARWSWGWGYGEVAGKMAREGRRKDAVIFTADTFSTLAMTDYLSGKKGLSVETLTLGLKPPKRLADVYRGGKEAYLVAECSATLPAGLFAEVERYPSEGHPARTERESARDGFHDKIVTSARIKMPYLVSITPAKGRPGTLVRIEGGNFGSRRGDLVVAFGGVPAVEYVSWTDDTVLARVPPGVPIRHVKVTIETPLGDSYFVRFRVMPESRAGNR